MIDEEQFSLEVFQEVDDVLVDSFVTPAEEPGILIEVRLRDGRPYGLSLTPDMAAATAHYLVHCLADMGYDVTSELMTEEVEALEEDGEDE